MPDLADCRDIAFNEIIVRNEASGAYAYFKLNEPSVSYKMSATDYYTTVSDPVFPFLSFVLHHIRHHRDLRSAPGLALVQVTG